MRAFPEVPVKQGVLFSEDENKTDADVQVAAAGGLVAAAKITLFQVELAFAFAPLAPIPCIM